MSPSVIKPEASHSRGYLPKLCSPTSREPILLRSGPSELSQRRFGAFCDA